MRRNVVAYLALFLALGGTSAYAANEWTGANIVDESLTGVDVRNGSIASRDITNGSLTGADVYDNTIGSLEVTNSSLTGSDIANASLGGDDLVNGAVTSPKVADASLSGADVANESLTGADVNESTLKMPPTTTATFAGPAGSVPLNGTSFTKVAAKTLPAGSYAIAATVNMHSSYPYAADAVAETVCDLRNGGGFIGGATDRRVIKEDDNIKVSLSMNGGAQVPAGGGEVSMWCLSRGGGGAVSYGQMMIIRIDGFS